MKKSIFTLLIIAICSFKLSSQVSVYRLDETDYEDLKNSTTYFIIPKFDDDKKQQYEKILKEVWTFNALKVVTFEESKLLDLKTNKSSVFDLRSIMFSSFKGGTTYDKWIDGFYLRMFNDNTNNTLESKIVARIEFCYGKIKGRVEDRDHRIFKNVYYNFSLGFIKNSLQLVNSELLSNTGNQKELMDIEHEYELKKLRSDTLFIPSYISSFSKTSLDEIFSNAKFKYKVISDNELELKILNSKERFYYLNFDIYNSLKRITIINSLTGNLSYSKFVQLSITLKPKDIKEINNLIKD